MGSKTGYRSLSCLIAAMLFASCASMENPPSSSEPQESSSMVQASSSEAAASSLSSEEDIGTAHYYSSVVTEITEDWMPYRPEEYLAPELPKLTAEELARVDEPVAQEVWESLNTGGMVLYIPHPNKQYPEDKSLRLDEWARRCLKKPNEEITYGELWRLNNANEELFLIFYVPYEYPEALKNLKSIKSIRMRPYFENNPFDSATDLSNLVAMTWLEELSLDGGNRHEYFRFPTELAKLTHLKKLEMTQCYITELPDFFDAFPDLEVLNVSRNEIAELPPSLYQCKKLKIMDIGETRVMTVPSVIFKLEELEELYLPCPILELSNNICLLKNLRILDLGDPYNGAYESIYTEKMITKLPNHIGNLKKLEVLDIDSMFQIAELPESITDCESLRILKAPRVIKAPEDMDKLKNLEESLIGDDWWTSYEQY